MSAAEEATAEKAAKRSLRASIMKRATMKRATMKRATMKKASVKKATMKKASVKKASVKKDSVKKDSVKKASMKKATNIGLAGSEEALAETTEEHTEANERTPLIPRLARRREDVGTRAFSWFAEARWLWVVLAAFYCTCTIDGCHYSAGVFEDPIAKELQLSHSQVVFTNCLEVGASNFVALLAPLLIEKLGLKRTARLGAGVATVGWLVIAVPMPISVGFEMLIAGKFLIGAGFGTLYLPVLIAVAKACPDHSSLALGCVTSGSGLGQAVFSFLGKLFLLMGWREALGAMSVICALCFFVSHFMPESGERRGEASIPEEASSDTEAAQGEDLSEESGEIGTNHAAAAEGGGNYLQQWFQKMRPLVNHRHRYVYFLFLVGDVVSVGALYLPYSSLPKLATSDGHDSEILIALLGLGSFLGRIIAGGLCSSSKVKPNILLMIALATAFAATLPLIMAKFLTSKEYYILVSVACCFHGFVTGIWIASTASFLIYLLGPSSLDSAISVLTAVRGLPATFLPILMSLLADHMEEPYVPLYAASILFAIAAIIFFLDIGLMKRQNQASGI